MWIKTENAYINLAHVIKVEPSGGRIKFTLANGDIINTTLGQKEHDTLRNYLDSNVVGS